MRTRERLIEVLASVPMNNSEQSTLRDTGRALQYVRVRAGLASLRKRLHTVMNSKSPHYRELAEEALHYLSSK